MRIQTFLSLILIVTLFIIGWGCVDVPSEGQLPPDYHALARFINVATDAPAGPVTVDGSSVGTLTFGAASSYIDYPAGGRKAVFASVSQTVDLRSQSQNSVLVIPLSNGSRFLVLDEGYNFVNNGKPGVASVRFVNVAQGSAPELSFADDSATGTTLKDAVGYLAAQQYTDISPGAHTIFVVSNGSYISTIDGASETPATGSTTTGTATVTADPANGLTYSITLSSSLSDSFYTSAHFHFGAVGAVGASFINIPVTDQTITFPSVTVSGAQAVPADTAIASGTGTLVLTRVGLKFTFDLLTDATYHDTEFVSGALRNAAAGANGPVVRTVLSGTSGDTTIDGTWKSTDAEPFTNALITELLAGRIYASFVTNNGSEIRGQLIPDNVISGTYEGSLATVPDSLRDSLNAGHVYINFHTAANPGGIIRGQVTTDPAGGVYGTTSLAGTYTAGHRYTFIATGKGNTLGLHVYSERQYGLTKEAVRTTSTPAHKMP
jgi:hypothetical protein